MRPYAGLITTLLILLFIAVFAKMGRFSKTRFIRCCITISENEIEDGECQFFEAGKIRPVARCDLIASILPGPDYARDRDAIFCYAVKYPYLASVRCCGAGLRSPASN